MNSDVRLTFGNLLRRHRQEAGLNLEELAERAGLSANKISLYERGARLPPSVHTVQQLATALSLTFPQLE